MDENFSNSPGSNEQNDDSAPKDTGGQSAENNVSEISGENENRTGEDINNYAMDDKGRIRTDRGSAVLTMTSARTYIILGWVSAAFTAFISPWFAIVGIIFGALTNRREKGKGTAIIITNIVLAAVNLIWRMMFRY